MINLKALGATLGAPLLLTMAAGGATAQVGSGDQVGSKDATRPCRVVVDRSQAGGVFDVTRQVDSDGDCVCYVSTGPRPQNSTIEGNVATLLRDRTCADARLMNVPGKEAAGGGLSGSRSARLVAAAGLTGAIALALSEKDKEKKDKRVSP